MDWVPGQLEVLVGGTGWKYSWGPQDDRKSISTIRRALEKGINWIDTAPVYGLGRSEEVVGKAIKGLRDKPIIATKCGRAWDNDRSLSGYLKKKSIRPEVEASLRRLGPGIEEKLLDYCSTNNIGVIVYSPMQKGLLTGRTHSFWLTFLPKDQNRKSTFDLSGLTSWRRYLLRYLSFFWCQTWKNGIVQLYLEVTHFSKR